MNTKLIQKYKKEFDHWLLNGNDSVMVKFPNACENYTHWMLMSDDPDRDAENWNSSPNYITYVINDQYVEFRKALAEGKTVQYNPKMSMHDRWDDIPEGSKLSPTKADNIENYRIKPCKPEYEVGEWLTYGDKPFQFASATSKDKNGSYSIKSIDGREIWIGGNCLGNPIEKWAPKDGEYCCFWNKGYKTTFKVSNRVTDMKKKYTYYEPYFGELPKGLK